MYCLISSQSVDKFIAISVLEPNLYALGVGNKIACWAEPKFVPLRKYQKLYPECRFWIMDKYELSDLTHCRFAEQ